MSFKRFKIDKLIRDHLPEIMREKGIQVHEKIMENDEYILRLKDKLLEEAGEVRCSLSSDDLIEELADILEVVQALSKVNGFTMEQVEERRLKKRNKKGGFDHKIYSDFVEIEENNQVISYYLERSQQYPEEGTRPYVSDCLFCQIACQERKADILEKFNHCYVIEDEYPVSKGHILLIPNEHTENWFTAREEVRQDMMKALIFMKERLDLECSAPGYNIGANCGETAGQSVMHLHVHLIPRYKGDMADPKGGVRGVIPSKQKY